MGKVATAIVGAFLLLMIIGLFFVALLIGL